MRTTTICPHCGREFTRIHTVDKPPKFCSRACANRAPGRMTPEIRARISRRGEEHPNFKGGWIAKSARGGPHWRMPVPSEERDGRHPTMTRRGEIARSHYVWNHAHPDNPVQPGEIIHHRNDDGLDDRPGNLQKFANQAEHMNHHRPQRSAAKTTYWDRKGRKNTRTTCEHCDGPLPAHQRHAGRRFCSYPCSVAARKGKSRDEFMGRSH